MTPLKKYSIKVLMLIIASTCYSVNCFSFDNILRLTTTTDTYSDEIVVRLKEDATFDFDPDWDAFKLYNAGNTPSLFTHLNGLRYVINSIPTNFDTTHVQLHLKAAIAGTYSLSASGLDHTFDSTYVIVLEDKLLQTQHNLRDKNNYEFDVTLNDSVNRFILHFYKILPSLEYPDLSANPDSDFNTNSVSTPNIELQLHSDKIFISFTNIKSETAFIGISRTNGKCIYFTENASTKNEIEIPIEENQKGIIIIRVIVDNGVICKKIYI